MQSTKAVSKDTAPRVAQSPLVKDLLAEIGAGYEDLSSGLKRIARYVEKNFDHLGLEKIQDVAKQCDIQPSAVVRFAKHFGFSGYSEMQKIFRDGMSAQISFQRNYQSRIRDLIQQSDVSLNTSAIAQSCLDGSIEAMQVLRQQLQGAHDMKDAVELLAKAPNLWVIGTNRAFPVATYLAYLLQHTDKPVHLVHGIGLMNTMEMRALRPDDVMLAISFSPYGKETLQAVDLAKERSAKIIAITDSFLSPLSQNATVSLVVTENSVFGFRSLTNTMVIAQSLFVALAYQLELDYQPTRASAV
jgi:DNA-binding MurR/RpiR family transcriptional regulator